MSITVNAQSGASAMSGVSRERGYVWIGLRSNFAGDRRDHSTKDCIIAGRRDQRERTGRPAIDGRVPVTAGHFVRTDGALQSC